MPKPLDPKVIEALDAVRRAERTAELAEIRADNWTMSIWLGILGSVLLIGAYWFWPLLAPIPYVMLIWGLLWTNNRRDIRRLSEEE